MALEGNLTSSIGEEIELCNTRTSYFMHILNKCHLGREQLQF